MVTHLEVKASRFKYTVTVGRGAWRSLRDLKEARYSSIFVLTEAGLWRRWGREFLRDSKLEPRRVLFIPAGELSKSLARVEKVVLTLANAGADRNSLLIAFGGGVVGDLAGFVAALYMRGIDYVHVPTTVVAQVDSSIGGKTGVDVGKAKNLVGAFYPPRSVSADPKVLRSLPARTFRSGFYEVIKHAILSGPEMFGELERRVASLQPDSTAVLESLIARAAKVKVEVVNRDEKEAGLRRVLNLGHTYGHALEAATGYRRFLHGEAVGWGLLGVTRLAERLGVLADEDARRIARLVRMVGPLPSIADISPVRVLSLLGHDKKTIAGQVHWVLPERIGKVRISSEVPASVVAETFRSLQCSQT